MRLFNLFSCLCFVFFQQARGFVIKKSFYPTKYLKLQDKSKQFIISGTQEERITIKAASVARMSASLDALDRTTAHSSSSSHCRIVFGTAALGKADNPFELLDAAYEKGFHRFDLARTYGGGLSEQIFGDWMQDRGVDRNSVSIITKGGMGQDKYGNPERPLLTREGLQEEIKVSLDALKTDWVEMYMFHRDDPRLHVSKFVVWANELVQAGKTKEWGVSNWSFERFQDAYEYAVSNNLEPPRANSPQFSLAVPKCDVWPTTYSISGPQYKEQIEWYNQHNVELLCWEVLAKGFMAKPRLWSKEDVDSSTFYKPTELGSDEWRLQRIQRAYCYDMNYRRRHVATEVAKKHGCKLSQVVVSFILGMGKNISVIFGSNNLNHLEDMVGLTECQLLDEEAKMRLSRLLWSPHYQFPQPVLEIPVPTPTDGAFPRWNETALAPS